MRAASLDHRVRKEAELLTREARAALAIKGSVRGKPGELAAAVTVVEAALAAKDYQRVRHGLPMLDALVDELVKHPNKSTTRDYVESIGAAVLIALALRAVVIEAFKIPSSSMYPTLEVNDHIFVNKLLYGFRIPFTTTKLLQWRTPHRGEVIVFMQPCEPDRDYIKRVIATEGQSVEVRCNVVYVNGKAVEHRLVQGDTCRYDDYDERVDKWFVRPCSEYAETVDGHEYRTYHDERRPQRDALAKDGLLSSPDDKDFPRRNEEREGPGCTDATGLRVPGLNQKFGTLVDEPAHGTAQPGKPGACDLQMHYVVPPGHVFVMGDNRANSNDSRYWGSVPIENIKGKALFIWFSYGEWEWQVRAWRLWNRIRWDRIGNFVQ
jgi:signal peptidase I